MPDVARRVVGRYEIVRELGRGPASTVHLARQSGIGRMVALKELRHPGAVCALSHPNILPVFDYFDFDGTSYVVTEHAERGSLRPYAGRLTLAQLGGVLEGVLAGLGHARSHGVEHGRLTLENLLLTACGSVKVSDFGGSPDLSAVARIASELSSDAGPIAACTMWEEIEETLIRLLGPCWRREAAIPAEVPRESSGRRAARLSGSAEHRRPAGRPRRSWALSAVIAAVAVASATAALVADGRGAVAAPATPAARGIAREVPVGWRNAHGSDVVPRADAAFGAGVGSVLTWLEKRERPIAARLAGASTRAERVAATKQLWWTYAGAAKRLRKLDAGPADRELRRQLAEALRLAGCAYGRAAGRADRAGYRREAQLALVHEVGVARALDGLREAGYELPPVAAGAARFTRLPAL